jgi:probable phosphoglycerate mutase
MELDSLDIKTAFLNGDLKEDVWVQQPPGYSEGGRQFSCKLHKALYGLKQAPRAWHKKLNEVLQNMGFSTSQSDPGLYAKHTEQGSTYLIVWVDDITIAADNIELVHNVKTSIMQEFEARDLGETKVFIGMEVQRDRTRRQLKLSQESAVRNIIDRYGQGDARVRDVPMAPGVQLTKEGDRLEEECRCQHGKPAEDTQRKQWRAGLRSVGDRSVSFESAWRERGLGVYQGLSYEVVEERFPIYGLSETAYRAVEATPEGGESFRDVKERVVGRFDGLGGGDDETLLLVTHGGPLCILLGHVKGLGLTESLVNHHPENCAVTELLVNGGETTIVRESAVPDRE